ncbi:DUF2510 domain-containing protein [Phycicoccus endophyticus]|uniref:DUF2510 domain-containing protein n=1 Tax=Phycicoccus endophyticus TaxID=1690220 RepID=UPI00197C041B|nr:DUF2510 domain-containing protein [Phycicoccus endophyticus]
MSAPPGWHRQPDGRDRWWDGQQWTDHVRDPQPTPPVPAPGAPAGATPPRQGMSGVAKGCLVAAVVGVVALVVAVAVVVALIARGVDSAVDDVRSALPTSTSFPSGLAEGGDPVVVTVGEGFELPGVSVDAGWSLADGSLGRDVEGMTATLDTTDEDEAVRIFSMSFEGGAETVCTASTDGGSQPVEVTCIPLFEDVPDDAEVTVTPTF